MRGKCAHDNAAVHDPPLSDHSFPDPGRIIGQDRWSRRRDRGSLSPNSSFLSYCRPKAGPDGAHAFRTSTPGGGGGDRNLKRGGKRALVPGGGVGRGKGIARPRGGGGVALAICPRRKEPLDAAAAEIARETN